jgi:4-hydroxybenzoate polyprenyltransferase
MSQMVSKKRAKALSVALFLIGLAIISYLNAWWPGIMLAVGIPLALRQYLLGRHYDMMVSLFVFIGVFVTVQFDISWEILLPVLFALGGVYILFREYLESKEETLEEEEEDINQEINEDQHK